MRTVRTAIAFALLLSGCGGSELAILVVDRLAGNPIEAHQKQVDDAEAYARAHAAYAAGNHHLLVGEADAAIRAYRKALVAMQNHVAYPDYAGCYRGLGLAFGQRGDRAAALKALETYVMLAPTATDRALIDQRIALLSQ